MSYLRAKRRATNHNVYLDNRLTKFTTPPVYFGNLYVENDEAIGGNLNVVKNEAVGGNLDVSGNLRIGGDMTARSFYSNQGNYYLDNYMLIPYGTIIQSAAVVIPDGWLLCDGSSLSIYVYVNLYNAIGYTYGGSDPSFNLPDIRGRVAVGTGSGAGLTTRNLGDMSGNETHVLTIPEMPSHSHTSNANGGPGSDANPALGLITMNGHSTMNAPVNDGQEPNLYIPPQALTINNTGGGNAHNIMQPFIVFNYLIKY
jgi:microcystin-dependent protein